MTDKHLCYCNGKMLVYSTSILAGGVKWRYLECTVCGYRMKSPMEPLVFQTTEPEKFENLYKKPNPTTGRKMSLSKRKFLYKRYVQTHRRVQKELNLITKAGFSLDKEGECAKIDVWKRENL